MVAYQPPDGVLLMVGASFRAAELAAASARIARLARQDAASLGRSGVDEHAPDQLEQDAQELLRALQDPVLRKNDNPLQMSSLTEVFAEIRTWLEELRGLAAINLVLDRPALARAWSPLPEVTDAYPRDVLRELEERVAAAKDLRPRLEDVGLDERFLGRGRKLLQQLQTAIGREDIQLDNLPFKTRRLYLKKGQVYVLLKRVCHAARFALRADPTRVAAYHLQEIEPEKRGRA